MRIAPFCLILLAGSLAAQRVLFQHVGPIQTRLGEEVRRAGDVDGDGVPDYVVTQPSDIGPDEVRVVSGASGSVIHSVTGIDPNAQSLLLDAVGLDDVDGDGRSDVAVLTSFELSVYSGASGQRIVILPATPQTSFVSVCEVGAFTFVGLADIAVATFDETAHSLEVYVLNGRTGAQLVHVGSAPAVAPIATLRPAGDLNFDGVIDLALGASDTIWMFANAPPALLFTISPTPNLDSGRFYETADLDGDGKREVLVGRPALSASTGSAGVVDVYSGATGGLRLRLELPFRNGGTGVFGLSVAGVGDLNQDGVGDVAAGVPDQGSGEVHVFSGLDGTLLWSFTASPPTGGCGRALAGIGDVDGDGFGDLAVGCPGPWPSCGYLVLSGRVLADFRDVGGACGSGPFLPHLGMSRPVIGRSLTIACRDGAAGALGVLLLSRPPVYPIPLGASTCSSAIDLGNWVTLHTTNAAQWSIQVPVPNVPQLAGVGIALQTIYGPTGGPLGYDLSNGLWARLGS